VRLNLEQAKRLVSTIRRIPELELCGPVHLSAVCFRHIVSADASEESRNKFNLVLLKKILTRGKVYLSNAELRARFCLRACIVNHRTTNEDIDSVTAEVLAAASELIEAG